MPVIRRGPTRALCAIVTVSLLTACGSALSDEQIWDLVNYVQSLPYEPISNPVEAATEAENIRERL